MSRKNLLNLIQVDADMPGKVATSDNKLVGQVASTMREEKARQARADDIERRLGEGQSVIDLDTALVEPSFVRDRMPGDIDGLLSSIREQGQQVPILHVPILRNRDIIRSPSVIVVCARSNNSACR